MECVGSETFFGLDVRRKSVVVIAALRPPVSQAKLGPTSREQFDHLRTLSRARPDFAPPVWKPRARNRDPPTADRTCSYEWR